MLLVFTYVIKIMKCIHFSIVINTSNNNHHFIIINCYHYARILVRIVAVIVVVVIDAVVAVAVVVTVSVAGSVAGGATLGSLLCLHRPSVLLPTVCPSCLYLKSNDSVSVASQLLQPEIE